MDGRKFKRGQMFTSIGKIREELAWYVGFRKHQYTDNQIRTALNNLVTHEMIDTAKTTRGLHITVCNYDTYQNPDNYEARKGQRTVQRSDQRNDTQEKPELYQKKEKNNNNNKKDIDKEISEIKDKDYSSVNTSVTSLEYDNQRQEYVEVVSEDRKNLAKLVTSLVEISKSWMPFQPESERYLVSHVIKQLGYDKAKEITEMYSRQVHKEETPIKSSAYWWKSGIFAWANKGQASKPIEKKIKRRCETCHTTQSFEQAKIPAICPLCSEGQLLSANEWSIRFPVEQPKPQPKEETLTEEESEAKANVEAFLEKFRSHRRKY